MATMDYSQNSPFTLREGEWLNNSPELANALSVGEESIARREIVSNASPSVSGTLRLTYFTARKTEQISKLAFTTGSIAVATPTLIRLAVYEVAANGDLTLVASTPNDTSLFVATFTTYEKTLSAPFIKVAGKRYAVGVLITAATAPNFYGSLTVISNILASDPRLSASVTTADIPDTVASASVGNTNGQIYAQLLP